MQSHLYYSMFYCAEALLLTRDLSFSKHSAVISAFGKEFVKSGDFQKELHGYLIEAFKERQKADYFSDIEFSKDTASEILKKSKEFAKETRKFMTSVKS